MALAFTFTCGQCGYTFTARSLDRVTAESAYHDWHCPGPPDDGS